MGFGKGIGIGEREWERGGKEQLETSCSDKKDEVNDPISKRVDGDDDEVKVVTEDRPGKDSEWGRVTAQRKNKARTGNQRLEMVVVPRWLSPRRRRGEAGIQAIHPSTVEGGVEVPSNIEMQRNQKKKKRGREKDGERGPPCRRRQKYKRRPRWTQRRTK
ncbi:hypothetical protein FA15DRAFT_656197 [Coprinopsis marcescibilis]|uniref:Uncharacterized protein n=1 Tax=Coprinopsis marcescibilis TaxID=230819 RepID=A0A5C3KU36_COPMA|nr:hypothetical protein FA15DRAFT_656197 [Coprinopsis marcescibilis]